MPANERAPRGSVVPEVYRDQVAYMRLWRERRPENEKRIRAKGYARAAAALEVAKAHPDEFAAAIARQEQARGLT